MLQGTETRDGCEKPSLPIGGEGNMHSPFSSFLQHVVKNYTQILAISFYEVLPR